MDPKIIPQFAEEEKQKWYYRILLGVIVLAIFLIVWGFSIINKVSPTSSVVTSTNQQQKPAQLGTAPAPKLYDFQTPAQPYTTNFPPALMVEAVANVNIQIRANGTTTIQTIIYDSANTPAEVLKLYNASLLKNKWTVSQYTTEPEFNFKAKDANGEVSISATPVSTGSHVVIEYRIIQ